MNSQYSYYFLIIMPLYPFTTEYNVSYGLVIHVTPVRKAKIQEIKNIVMDVKEKNPLCIIG